MSRIVVVSTGGTIASRWQGSGYAAATPGGDLLAEAGVPAGITTEVVDLFTVNSALLTTAQQLTLLRRVHAVLEDPEVDGVVVTHGTDTLEESAFLLDLYHADPRPVVFTGAQRPMTVQDSDAPANLRDALLTAATVRDAGVLVVFNGRIHAARGTVKHHTLDADAFGDPSDLGGPGGARGTGLGDVRDGVVLMTRRPERPAPLPLPSIVLDGIAAAPLPRVDLVMHHTGADPSLLRAALGAGAAGVVLVATGAGNATPEFAEAVHEAVGRGVLVALTTRVAAGPIAELYTGGGAVDLVAAGAVATGTLRAAQARIAVLAALMAGGDAAGPAGRTALLRRLLTPGHDGAALRAA